MKLFRWIPVFSICLVSLLLVGCGTPRSGAGGGGAGARSASGLKSSRGNEFHVQKYSRFVMPGMTLSEVNGLMGWAADFKQGMHFWTPQRGLLVQSKRAGQDVLDEALIVSVFDFYRRKMYRLSSDQTTITIAEIPADLMRR